MDMISWSRPQPLLEKSNLFFCHMIRQFHNMTWEVAWGYQKDFCGVSFQASQRLILISSKPFSIRKKVASQRSTVSQIVPAKQQPLLTSFFLWIDRIFLQMVPVTWMYHMDSCHKTWHIRLTCVSCKFFCKEKPLSFSTSKFWNEILFQSHVKATSYHITQALQVGQSLPLFMCKEFSLSKSKFWNIFPSHVKATSYHIT